MKTNRRSFGANGRAFVGVAATSATSVFGVTDAYKRLSGSAPPLIAAPTRSQASGSKKKIPSNSATASPLKTESAS